MVLLAGAGRVVTITLLAVTVAMFAYPLINATGVFWSPYYRVTTFTQSDRNNGTQWQIYVNGIPQRLTTAATRLKQEPFYDEPYRRVTKPPEQVLIVGAGTGTDVSIAPVPRGYARRCSGDRPAAAALRKNTTRIVRTTILG